MVILLACCHGCKEPKVKVPDAVDFYKLRGTTMGTTYNITYEPYKKLISKATIDSILRDINLSVSTYIDSSTISKINNSSKYGRKAEILINGKIHKSDKVITKMDQHFLTNYKAANRIYLDTDGSFDPTVMPLVNYWGFGYKPKKPVTKVDSQKVSSILKLVGMTCVKPVGVELDFSAIAKGYAVDYLAMYLRSQGVENLMVEIGGEVYAQGHNATTTPWTIGLNTPDSESTLQDFMNLVHLKKMSVASSGNYRIFHIVNGKKYSHEINPKSGYPERNELLQVSVLARNCMEADAVATALMIMGKKKGMAYIESKPGMEAVFFYGDKEGGIAQTESSGFAKYKAVSVTNQG